MYIYIHIFKPLFEKLREYLFNYVNIKEKGRRMLLNIRPIVRLPRRTSQGSSALSALPGHTTTRPTPTPTTNGYQGEEVAWKMFAKSGTSLTQSWRRCENPSSMDSMSQRSLSLEQSETRKAWTISFFSMHCANHSTRQSKIRSQTNPAHPVVLPYSTQADTWGCAMLRSQYQAIAATFRW